MPPIQNRTRCRSRYQVQHPTSTPKQLWHHSDRRAISVVSRVFLTRRCLRSTIKARIVWSIVYVTLCYCPAWSHRVVADTLCPHSAHQTGCTLSADIGSISTNQAAPTLIHKGIDPFSASVHHFAVDYREPDSHFMFGRHYISPLPGAGINVGMFTPDNPLGRGWRSTYDVTLQRTSGSRLKVTQSNTTSIHFIQDLNTPQQYTSTSKDYGHIAHDSPHYYWHRPDGSSVTFKGPIPVKFEFPAGESIQLSYRDNRLSRLTHSSGRTVTLHYRKSLDTGSNQRESQLASLELPDGDRLHYQYQQGHLTGVVHNDDQRSQYRYTNDFSTKRLAMIRERSGANRRIHYDKEAYPIHVIDLTHNESSHYRYTRQAGSANQTSIRLSTGESAQLSWPLTRTTESVTHDSGSPAQDQPHVSLRFKHCDTCRTLSLAPIPERDTATTLPLHPIPVTLSTGLLGVVSTATHGINHYDFRDNENRLSDDGFYREHQQLLRPMLVAGGARLSAKTIGAPEQTCPVLIPENDPAYTSSQEMVDNTQENDERDCSDEIVNSSSIPGATVRDIRTDDCESYFVRYSGINRGIQLETAISNHEDYRHALFTSRRFPVVDFVIDTTAVVSKSRDLSTASYSTNRPVLYQTLLRDAAIIHERFIAPLRQNGQVSATERGVTTTITDNDVTKVVYELTVRRGTATDFQILQLQRARQELLSRYAITLQIVEIP